MDPHGLLDTKNIVSTTVRVVVDGYCSQEVPGGKTGGEMVWCSSRTLLKAMVGLASSKVARRVELQDGSALHRTNYRETLVARSKRAGQRRRCVQEGCKQPREYCTRPCGPSWVA